MTKLEQIEKSIEDLSDRELKELAAWFDELRWQRWDRQLEADVAAGRLDRFIADAKAAIAAGRPNRCEA
jgi:ABC-type phosphate transport system auxiliary subunit